MKPFLEDPDLTLYQGDALEVLQSLPSGSVHMCVTSPPFYGLRDYGTGSWEGGNPDCDHTPRVQIGMEADSERGRLRDKPSSLCKCGARRVDQQIGLEETPEQWVEKLVSVFREVRRVLRADGTCWVEVGDSYASNPGSGQARGNLGGLAGAHLPKYQKTMREAHRATDTKTGRNPGRSVSGMDSRARGGSLTARLKQKDLIGAPWMLAFALRADGWFLRSDIIWSRPNPMPESVTDRPTKSHSYVFLLSKSARYFFDQEAIREQGECSPEYVRAQVERNRRQVKTRGGGSKGAGILVADEAYSDGRRNVRSVWQIATQPYPEAHFATYPEELVRRCILAGSSERGCCPECGAPWMREVARTPEKPNAARVRNVGGRTDGLTRSAEPGGFGSTAVTTVGWRRACSCPAYDGWGNAIHAPAPCTVLDPFFGSGTTGLVARKHGRRTIGIELSAEYCGLAARRLQQLSLLGEALPST